MHGGYEYFLYSTFLLQCMRFMTFLIVRTNTPLPNLKHYYGHIHTGDDTSSSFRTKNTSIAQAICMFCYCVISRFVSERAVAKNILQAYSGKTLTPSPQPQTPKPPSPHVTGRQSASRRPHGRLNYRSNTPASTPISTPYVPMAAPAVPSPKMSFTAYSPPVLLN